MPCLYGIQWRSRISNPNCTIRHPVWQIVALQSHSREIFKQPRHWAGFFKIRGHQILTRYNSRTGLIFGIGL